MSDKKKLSSTFSPVVVMQVNDCKQEAPSKPVSDLLAELRGKDYEVTRLTKKTRMFAIRHEDEAQLHNLCAELNSNPLVLEAKSDREWPKDIPETMTQETE